MRFWICILLIGINSQLFSQSSTLIFFTQEGELFTAFIDGRQINEVPEMRVEAKEITSDFVQVRIQFEKPGAPVINKPIMIEQGKEMTIAIARNKNGKYVLRMVGVGETPIGKEKDEVVKIMPGNQGQKVQTTSTTISTQSTPDYSNQSSVGITVSDNAGVSINMNVNINDDLPTSTTYSETTMTEISSTYDGSVVYQEVNEGCSMAMSELDFSRANQSISTKDFDDEKMTVFKQVIRNNCISVDQVIGFMELFTYEDDKLEVAKLSYEKTVDKNNYYRVNDAFTYSDSIEELNEFLEGQ